MPGSGFGIQNLHDCFRRRQIAAGRRGLSVPEARSSAQERNGEDEPSHASTSRGWILAVRGSRFEVQRHVRMVRARPGAGARAAAQVTPVFPSPSDTRGGSRRLGTGFGRRSARSDSRRSSCRTIASSRFVRSPRLDLICVIASATKTQPPLVLLDDDRAPGICGIAAGRRSRTGARGVAFTVGRRPAIARAPVQAAGAHSRPRAISRAEWRQLRAVSHDQADRGRARRRIHRRSPAVSGRVTRSCSSR